MNDTKFNDISLCLGEIDEIHNSEINNDLNNISLFDIAGFMKKAYDKINACINDIKEKTGKDIVVLTDFYNFYAGEYKVKLYMNDIREDVYFGRDKNNSFHILPNNLINGVDSELLHLYDLIVHYKELFDSLREINSVDSKFYIDINFQYSSAEHVSVNSKTGLFSLTYTCDDDKLKVSSISDDVKRKIAGSEEDLFKKIVLRIDKCPKNIQSELYDYKRKILLDKKNDKSNTEFDEVKQSDKKDIFSIFRRKH